MLQSSRAFKANFTISIKLGNATQSNFCFCWTLIDGSGASVRGMLIDDEFVVMLWIRFCLFPLLLTLPPCISNKLFSVCFFHKFKFWEFSICFWRHSRCCLFAAVTKWFHCNGEKINSFPQRQENWIWNKRKYGNFLFHWMKCHR